MSLDVTLIRQRLISYDRGITHTEENEEVYWANITHNLGKMATESGIYEAIWRPYMLRDDFKEYKLYSDDEYEFEKKCVIKASDITEKLEKGLADLKARPDHFKQFDADNGWGIYDQFVPFVEQYLEACKQYPDAIVLADR